MENNAQPTLYYMAASHAAGPLGISSPEWEGRWTSHLSRRQDELTQLKGLSAVTLLMICKLALLEHLNDAVVKSWWRWKALVLQLGRRADMSR
jgi:hypothetical protein